MDINTLVVASLQSNHEFGGHIWTIENAEKYSTLPGYTSALNQQVSEEILALMTTLNTEGISGAGLCASPCGSGSLGEILYSVASDLVDLLGPGSLHYVELGPEPVKTSALMGYLLDCGSEPQH
ncbi:MAG: hypothetical protein ACRC1I_13940 [Pseudomonas proteolytica]|uniref:hypothetical protein n=1 Tax=Pseudomonas proteolytica TaxID=219574 RepID=UPI003F335FFD